MGATALLRRRGPFPDRPPDTLFATRYDAYRPYGVFILKKSGILQDAGGVKPSNSPFEEENAFA